MYELGRKKLLRKCENKQMPTTVVNLTVTGDRVFAGDQMESCHCFKYRRMENQLVEFADDQVKDWGVVFSLYVNVVIFHLVCLCCIATFLIYILV